MQHMANEYADNLQRIREQKPLIHHITNFVVMNETANATLCIGALPVMAHAKEEVAEMVGFAGALVLNIGISLIFLDLAFGQIEWGDTWAALAEAIASMDAPHVERMRASGAIPIGRTNLPDFGLRVHTAVDVKMQEAAEQSLAQGLRDLDKRQGFRGRVGYKEVKPNELQLSPLHLTVKPGEVFNAHVIAVGVRDDDALEIGR